MTRRLISTNSPFERAAGYSRAVVDGDVCFVAGTTGYDYAAMAMPAAVAAQAENAMATIAGALATWTIGDPSDPATDIGPVIDEDARAMLQRHVERLEREIDAMTARLELAREMACDARAALNSAADAGYADSLLTSAEILSQLDDRRDWLAVGMFGRRSALTQRIDGLLAEASSPEPPKRRAAMALLISRWWAR